MSASTTPLVRPRAIDARFPSSTPVLLDEAIRAHLERGETGRVKITGPAGSGKTSALEYLARVFADEPRVCTEDVERPRETGAGRILVYAGRGGTHGDVLAEYVLARWDRDEAIEYLLATHPDRCASVVARLSAETEALDLKGNAELWRIVLDELARDDKLATASDALRRYLHDFPDDPELRRVLRHSCLTSTVRRPQLRGEKVGAFGKLSLLYTRGNAVERLAHQRAVRLLLAALAIRDELRAGQLGVELSSKLPAQLVSEVGNAIRDEPDVHELLKRTLLGDEEEQHAPAATWLHAADREALAAVLGECREQCWPKLSGAHLPGATWGGLSADGLRAVGAHLRASDLSAAVLDRANLRHADLCSADLSGASLREAQLDHARLSHADLGEVDAAGASFAHARLDGTRLKGARAPKAVFDSADLTAADLRGADLSGATLRLAKLAEASLVRANLERAGLTGVDLRRTALSGAHLAGADLSRANLERVRLPHAELKAADLRGALLSESHMQDGSLQSADLRQTGLAGVDWERADLRAADLRHATFHLGTSRSGLIFGQPPMEGTRTGFYSDEYRERFFKDPSVVRTANLRGADLRGALLEGTDFYLVDLRDARIMPDQEQHLRRCGAILEDR